ncbi:TPA: hypothetical protein ACGUVT_004420 [Vibrio vulnificus]
MKQLQDLISSDFTEAKIDLDKSDWHAEIPNKPGWYFLATDIPLEILKGLPAPPKTYVNEAGETKNCKNYNLGQRARSLFDSPLIISNLGLTPVYSGMAKNLKNRAREHTFGHKGTAALALSNYSCLYKYNWSFYYLENQFKTSSKASEKIMLKLGEEMWRANNGWPILSAG